MSAPSWGPLGYRFEAPRPRRMLALDGGGIRGLLSLGVLAALERKLAAHYRRGDFRLCHFFDYIAGTSTGAITAAALSRGLSVQQVVDFYQLYGEEIFKKRRWGIWNSLYRNGPLEQRLKQVYGEQSTLEAGNLNSLLLVVMRNATTDSAWPLSSNPFAMYNEPGLLHCNLRVPLWRLVRASTAAPVFFPAEVIEWEVGNAEQTFAFVDGGTTAYNNPAFLLFRMATEPRYRLGWQRGEDKLLIVSVGTGENAELGLTAEDPVSNLVTAGKNTLVSLMSQAAYDQDVNCRTIGRCIAGGPIDLELGDLVLPPSATAKDWGRAFLYARYNALLEPSWLETHGLGDIDAASVRGLDAVDRMPELRRIGDVVGAAIKVEDFGVFLNEPLYVEGQVVAPLGAGA